MLWMRGSTRKTSWNGLANNNKGTIVDHHTIVMSWEVFLLDLLWKLFVKFLSWMVILDEIGAKSSRIFAVGIFRTPEKIGSAIFNKL